MKISGSGPLQSTPVRRRERSGRASGTGFAGELGADGAVRSAGPTTDVNAVNALLSVQELEDAGAERRRAVARADDILDQLDELRHGLLIGAFPAGKLKRLLVLVRRQEQRIADPRLREVLAEIELRAAVELAKLGRTP